jgi:hypothetical protein
MARAGNVFSFAANAAIFLRIKFVKIHAIGVQEQNL